jgi:ArsR family transcriptional regulator
VEPGAAHQPAHRCQLLSRAGLVSGKKVKQWVFYKRDEERIAQVKEELAGDW